MRIKQTHKTCTKCKETKTLDLFSPRKSMCKKCNAEYAAKKAAEKRAENAAIENAKLTYPRIPDNMKQCKYCHEIKVKEGNYRRQAECAGGVVAKCNTCFNRDRPSRVGSEYAKKIWAEYYAKHKEELLKKNRENERRKEYLRKRYIEKKDEILEKQRAYGVTPRARAMNAKRQSHRNRKLKCAQPDWLNEEQLREMEYIYWLAQDLKTMTDTVYHVDHIVPLQGKTICGLHVPWNLQILPASVNIRKSNKLET